LVFLFLQLTQLATFLCFRIEEPCVCWKLNGGSGLNRDCEAGWVIRLALRCHADVDADGSDMTLRS
jgi:hypothetical protein